jgi:hypothetical protein
MMYRGSFGEREGEREIGEERARERDGGEISTIL